MRVVISWNSSCGTCWHCRRGESIYCLGIRSRFGLLHDSTSRLRLRGQRLIRGMDAGTFCQENVFHENALVAIDPRLEVQEASLLGCTVPTGVGAVRNAAGVRPGDRVAGHPLRRRRPVRDPGCRKGQRGARRRHRRVRRPVAAGRTPRRHRDRLLGEPGRDRRRGQRPDRRGRRRPRDRDRREPETIALAVDIVRRGGCAVVVGNSPPYQPIQLFPGS